MLLRWQNSNCSRTSIAFLVSYPFPGSEGCLVIPWRWSSLFVVAEKNGLRRLRTSLSELLRQALPTCSRSLLWRQARLSRLPLASAAVYAVLGREDRTPRLARGQSTVHQAVRVFRRPPLSPNSLEGGGRGTVPRLARGQGAGQAVHARAIASHRLSRSSSDRYRRNCHRQGTPVPHRGERPGTGPTHLVRRYGPFRSQPGRVLRLARPGKMQE